MKLDKRDALATAAVAAIVVPYAGYLVWDEMPLIEDARGMGVVGLVLGAVAWWLLGTKSFGTRLVAAVFGAVSLGLGVTAAILETGTASDWFLAAFVGSIVALWLEAMWHHLAQREPKFGGVRPGHI